MLSTRTGQTWRKRIFICASLATRTADATKKLHKAESQRDNFSKRLAASEQRIKDVENESAALRAYRDTLQTELAAVREELKMCREKALEGG